MHSRRIVASLLFAVALDCSRETSSPVDEVVLAARGTARVYEARMMGQQWSPVHDGKSGAPRSTETLEFEGTAGTALRRATRDAAWSHAAGVAIVLLGRPRDGGAQLERAAHLWPHDARIWNDLAVARAAQAVDDPARLPAALAAADRAIELKAAGAEPFFNRALILTRLGFRQEAARAWRLAAEREFDEEWDDEIRRRLAACIRNETRADPKSLDAALRARDIAQVRRFVAENLESVRAVAETIRVSEWAHAIERGDVQAGERILGDLQLLSVAVAEANGDRFLQDVVRHLERNRSRHAAIARVHLMYRDARLHYRDQAKSSDRELRDVAASFERLGSPMEHVARYYAANATFDRNQVEAARAMLERVLADIEGRGYRSLAAGTRKQLGLCYGFQGLWTASLLHLDRAFGAFRSIGEPVNAAFTQAILGEAYDRIGQIERGWRHRVAALNVLGADQPNQRLVAVVIGAVHAEILRGDFAAARSLLTIGRAQADSVGDPLLTSEMMVREVRALMILQSTAAARDLLAAAKLVSSRIDDPVARLRVDSDIRIVEGAMLRVTKPRAAIEIITPAIAFYEANGFEILLPDAYLERGRAHLANGDPARAIDDYQKGLAALEHQRANTSAEIRTRIFDTVPELVAEAIELLLRAGREREAFAVLERARARTLTEALAGPSGPSRAADIDSIIASVPEDGLLVEYALLPGRVVAFCLRRERGLTVVELPVEPEPLRKNVEELTAAIDLLKPEAELQRVAATLHEGLIRPLGDHLTGVETLYVVPDRFLYAVPFNALFDRERGQYLIEQKRVVIAPSGAFLLRRQGLTRTLQPALIVSDPAGERQGKWLPAARREAAAIAGLYDRAVLIGGPDATVERFTTAVRDTALLHYAGHAGTDDAGGGFLPLAPSAHDDGRLDATAISHLRLRNAALVILSACATMRGHTARVEGMPSISRAFLAAGSPAVLGMLWDVRDEDAARLLLGFHTRLVRDRSPSGALQAVQRDFIRSDDPRLRHPGSWAFAELLGVD